MLNKMVCKGWIDMKTFPAIGVVTALFACSNVQEPPAKDPAQSNQPIESALDSSAINSSEVITAQENAEAVNVPPSPTANFSSEYTSLKNTKCVTVELDEEAAGYIREQCGDFKGVPLFRVEGDLRQSAYAGNQPSGQTTIGPFNYLTDMVEWRIQAGRPIALIYRLKADAPDMPDNGRTQLFVQKIGVNQTKSCIVGMIAGNYPNANAKAREIADSAVTVACSNGLTPTTFGDLM